MNALSCPSALTLIDAGQLISALRALHALRCSLDSRTLKVTLVSIFAIPATGG